jgi:hypothetical protein
LLSGVRARARVMLGQQLPGLARGGMLEQRLVLDGHRRHGHRRAALPRAAAALRALVELGQQVAAQLPSRVRGSGSRVTATAVMRA